MPPARILTLSSFLLFSRFNSTLSFCAARANTHRLFFSTPLMLQPQPFLCVSPAGTLSPFLLLLYSRCKYNCFFVCPQREKTASLLFSCSSAAISLLSLCASSANPQLICFSSVLALQVHASLCVPQRERPTVFLFSCSHASTPRLSLCVPCANTHPFFFSPALVLQPYPFLCVPPELTPFPLFPSISRASTPPLSEFATKRFLTLYSYIKFSRVNLSAFFVCPQRYTSHFRLYSSSCASNSSLFCVSPA